MFIRILLIATAFASIAAMSGDDAARVHTLATKVFCNCGCSEILAECSHSDCKTRVPLKQKISSLVQSGKTDDEVLGEMEKDYGAMILVVPSFRGFNILLWAVPVGAAVVAIAIFLWRRRAGESQSEA